MDKVIFKCNMNNLKLINPCNNEELSINNFLDASKLNDENKTIFIVNNRKGKSNNAVSLGKNHNNEYFEFFSNHPLLLVFFKDGYLFKSATFPYYIKIIQNENMQKISSKELLDFYENIKNKGLLEEYLNTIYHIFTHAYPINESTIPKDLKNLREQRR